MLKKIILSVLFCFLFSDISYALNSRVLVYNKTEHQLTASLSSHGAAQKLCVRRSWAQWRVRSDDETFILRIYKNGRELLKFDIKTGVHDKHITIYERSSGFYYKFEEQFWRRDC